MGILLLSPDGTRDAKRQVWVLLLFISGIRNAHTAPAGLRRQQGPREGEGVCAAQGQL